MAELEVCRNLSLEKGKKSFVTLLFALCSGLHGGAHIFPGCLVIHAGWSSVIALVVVEDFITHAATNTGEKNL